MAEMKMNRTVTLMQAAELIKTNPETRFLMRSEPGIGKSSMGKYVAEQLGMPLAYIDVPNMDLGDIAMPVIDHATKTTRYYPNARFNMHEGKPVVIMLDEFTKGADPVKNMLHPLLEKANPRLGDVPVHPESRIFLTGNLSTDGVGDSLKAHSLNRIVPLMVAKPTADEWLLNFGMPNGLDPAVLAWVSRYQHVLASYTSGDQDDNEFIYSPKNSQKAYVSPRSLETASNILSHRAQNHTDAVAAALEGALGVSGAHALLSFVTFSDQLPEWDALIAHPETTNLPQVAGAMAITVYSAQQRVTKDTLTPFMKYLNRMDKEWQAVFVIGLTKIPAKQQMAYSNTAMSHWLAENHDLL